MKYNEYRMKLCSLSRCKLNTTIHKIDNFITLSSFQVPQILSDGRLLVPCSTCCLLHIAYGWVLGRLGLHVQTERSNSESPGLLFVSILVFHFILKISKVVTLQYANHFNLLFCLRDPKATHSGAFEQYTQFDLNKIKLLSRLERTFSPASSTGRGTY